MHIVVEVECGPYQYVQAYQVILSSQYSTMITYITFSYYSAALLCVAFTCVKGELSAP